MSKKIIINEIYDSILVNKFINCFQKKGKKSFIENKFYTILLKFKKKKINGTLLFFYCVELIKPTMVVISAIKSGITYSVGSMLPFQYQYYTALRWLSKAIVTQKNKNVELQIINEILGISLIFKSTALKKKRENYLTIFKNRSLTHFRWR